MRIVTAIMMVFVLTAWLPAQESGPSEPTDTEILIPDLLLRVEELTVEEVDSVLPGEGDLALGQISIPLPGAEDLAVDDAAFEVRRPLEALSTGGGVSSFFSSGRLGAGMVNHVVGELSLYKLGDSPRFRLEFSHEGMDGYQFHEPGTGYFSNTNAVRGWLARASEATSLDLVGSFEERAEGLQGQSTYFSVGTRATSASASLEWIPDPLIQVSADLDGSMTSRIFSASGGGPVPRQQEFVVAPRIEGVVSISAVDLSLETSYLLRFLSGGEIPVHQDIDLIAGVSLALPSLALAGEIGIFYPFGGRLQYPWSVSVGALLGEAFEATLRGGYRVEQYRLTELWSEHMLLAPGDADGSADLESNEVWFAELDTRWSGPAGLTASGALGFAANSGIIEIQPFDGATDLFPFIQRSSMILDAAARVGWQPSPRIQFEVGWSGAFLDTITGVPTSSMDASIRVTDRNERFEGAVEGHTSFYPEPLLPWLGVSGAFNASEGVEFVLEVADILAPLATGGRPTIGPLVDANFPFISPGLRASLFARISL
jgi:hypothetical protein